MPTPYHSAYYAHELTRRSASSDFDKLGASLANATVDLNPHQLDAALFAFRSPLSRGALLADEVGLGKTIEAGLIISQLWAERKRKILVIAPTILRKQWAQELSDKFFVPSIVLDTREYNALHKSGKQPFLTENQVVIISYHFARTKSAELARIPWDLVIIDEAHRLRNVYKPNNKIANAIKAAVKNRPVLLLTATPLQNSLLELYGLISFLDEHLFGDIEAFRARYMRGNIEQRQLDELKQRLRPICQRTLRRQVTEYVRFTNRIPMTQDFTPTDDEQTLYNLVTEYLQRDTLHALPASQRKLMTLVLRKLLASSTYAIAGTFQALSTRLKMQQDDTEAATQTLENDFESYAELSDEWTETPDADSPAVAPKSLSAAVQAEIEELANYGALAASITVNAKGEALLAALQQGFEKLSQLGAASKAIIFTESRRTQAYLQELLATRTPYNVMTLNGTNTDEGAGKIYSEWVKRHHGESVVTGNKPVDIRAALVEHFRDNANILIATEAAAEGVNLQFCSLVVNYDLPWNPQRIEQRIGRCHRYGQQHDVVVINFLNRANEADQRVFQLLSEKFKLFDGVFGSSDEILGALESGVDFEQRIAQIYQSCRTANEINSAFAQLRSELEEPIAARMTQTRSALLEHFDQEVHDRLKLNLEQSKISLGKMERWLWNLTKSELDGCADFNEDNCEFTLYNLKPSFQPTQLGTYQCVTRSHGTTARIPYRLGHSIAQDAIAQATSRSLPLAHLHFDYNAYSGKIGLLENYRGKSGWLALDRFTVSALEDEDRLLFAIIPDQGEPFAADVTTDFCEKLFLLPAKQQSGAAPAPEVLHALQQQQQHAKDSALAAIAARNTKFFDEEIDKLERWADDLKHSLEMELKDLDLQIKQADREAKSAPTLDAKLEHHRIKKELEAERSRKRRELYEAQDKIEADKDALIDTVAAKLNQTTESKPVFIIRWSLN